MLQDLFPKNEKVIHLKKSKLKVYKTVYLLKGNEVGLRVEETKSALTHTAEIILLYGDGKLIQKKIILRKAIKNATRKEMDQTVEQFIFFAIMKCRVKPKKTRPKPPGINKEQAAFFLGLTPYQVMDYVKRGKLYAEVNEFQGKKNYFISPSSLENFVRASELAKIS